MDVDLFLKKVPLVVKELIGREANENRRSINQEAIALLEEALLHRVQAQPQRRRPVLETLQSYVDAKNLGDDAVPLAARGSSVGGRH